MDNKTDITALTRLIETTLDSADGCEEAADEAQGSALRSMLRERSEARRAVASMLQECVRALGGEPDEDVAALASAHRSVLSLPLSTRLHATRLVVEEAKRGESCLTSEFESAMHNLAVSPHTRKTIANACRRIRAGQDPKHDVTRVLHG